LLVRTAPRGIEKVKQELDRLGVMWAGAALPEVSDADGRMKFQSDPFQKPYGALPPMKKNGVTFYTINLDNLKYRIAMRAAEVNGQTFLVVLASLAGYWLSRRALAPVNAIIKTARGVGVQNLSVRLAVRPANDELRRLSETLNAMLGRIEASVERITRFTADVSHDLRTPVPLIRTSAELALRRPRTKTNIVKRCRTSSRHQNKRLIL
jgi:signal transduction histidine kinase